MEWVKFYGQRTSSSQFLGVNSPLVVDAMGNLFAWLTLDPGAHGELPLQKSLWDSQHAIVKFNAAGDIQWAVPTSLGFGTLVAVGTDVWIALSIGQTEPSISFKVANTTFAVPSGYPAATAIAKLSGVTGDVLDSFQLDHWDGGHPHPILLSDGTNIWLANSGGTFKRGNWAWLPPSDASRSYIYPFGGDPIWLSGFIGSGLVLDAQKRLVVDELVEWSGTFELGGVTIVNSNHAHQGCARYSNSLLPETGFVGRLGGSLVSGANSVLYSPGQESLFAEYADDGTLIRQGGDHGQPGLRDPQIQGGHLFGHGMSYSSAYAYGGHVLPPNAPLIWSYNPASLQLERFLYFDTVLQNDGNGFAVVDGGKAVVVAVAFRGAFKLPNKTYDFGADTLGVALIKVRLFQ